MAVLSNGGIVAALVTAAAVTHPTASAGATVAGGQGRRPARTRAPGPRRGGSSAHRGRRRRSPCPHVRHRCPFIARRCTSTATVGGASRRGLHGTRWDGARSTTGDRRRWSNHGERPPCRRCRRPGRAQRRARGRACPRATTPRPWPRPVDERCARPTPSSSRAPEARSPCCSATSATVTTTCTSSPSGSGRPVSRTAPRSGSAWPWRPTRTYPLDEVLQRATADLDEA